MIFLKKIALAGISAITRDGAFHYRGFPIYSLLLLLLNEDRKHIFFSVDTWIIDVVFF